MDIYPLIGPLLRLAPPECAHRASIFALKWGLVGDGREADDPVLRTQAWGLDFPNPVGLAAGFDKNAEVADLFPGFGFAEVGTVTPRPQAGNPRPRLFRLPEDGAVINRLGFNSEGAQAVRARLARRKGGRVLGVNLGRNRDSLDAAADYVAGLRALGPYADYAVINVSSPNTPGLRDLQERAALSALIARLMRARGEMLAAGRTLPLLLKIAPDLMPAQMADIAQVASESGIDGLIVGNTTVARPAGLKSRHRGEAGGLSGRPLFAPSTEVLRAMFRLTKGHMPLIGTGGIASGADAYAKIKAGASLVQLYTALIYQGPGLVGRIKAELAQSLKRDGFTSVAQAVGVEAR